MKTLPLIIFPATYGALTKIDEYFTFEKRALRDTGFKYAYFNFDEFIKGAKLKFNTNVNPGKAIYRGWMLNEQRYKKLYNALKEIGIELINNPKEYVNCHYFVDAYKKLETYTPKALFYENENKIDWDEVKSTFTTCILKDYVKTVKGFPGFPEYIDTTLPVDELKQLIHKFISLRGSLISGGICFKQRVPLWNENGMTFEFRGIFINGEFVDLFNIERYRGYKIGDRNVLNDKLRSYFNKLPKLDSNFYTVDVALKENGDYTVIEVGDGQVSGLDCTVDAERFYEALKEQFK